MSIEVDRGRRALTALIHVLQQLIPSILTLEGPLLPSMGIRERRNILYLGMARRFYHGYVLPG